MEHSDRLRIYATQLFAMAIKAQERGEASYADQLTMRAANYLDRATAIETSITQQTQPEEGIGTSQEVFNFEQMRGA